MSTGCLCGTLDCGLFAVVYATEVCKGNSQADVTFNQKGCDIICILVPIAIASAYQMVMSLNQLINRSLLSMQAARGA